MNEASLTGESTPVRKLIQALLGDVFHGDRRNMVFMGTTVDRGRGKAVVEPAMTTELGKIAGLVQQETQEQTPLQKRIDRLGRQIGVAVPAIEVSVFLIGLLGNSAGLEPLVLTPVRLAVGR